MSLTALVPAHFHEELRMRSSGLGVELVPYDKDGKPLGDASGATVLFRWWIPVARGDQLLRDYPLRWIHTGSAGVDHILTQAFRDHHVVLTNSSGVHAPSIAEWVVLGILAQEKDLSSIDEQQRQRRFEKVQRDELVGKHVVILGAGHIAREVAARLRPFGVRISSVRRRAEPDPRFDAVTTMDDRAALADADWLIVTLPLTPATRHLIDSAFLDGLAERCRIVNVARGEIIDQPALVEALRSGRIAGAVLDVFEQEPLPEDHPFWGMKNVLVLPHTTWRSPQVQERQISLFLENLRRYAAGEPLLNVVDVDAGY